MFAHATTTGVTCPVYFKHASVEFVGNNVIVKKIFRCSMSIAAEKTFFSC